MINDFAAEFKRLLEGTSLPTNSHVDDIDVGMAFEALIHEARDLLTSTGSARGMVIEIPPGHFSLPWRQEDRDHHRRSPYKIPENVQLYFCPGALLRPADNVDLVIRGSLRAGMYQIFGYDRLREATLQRPREGRTPPRGRIIFAGRLVPALYPEWWGAKSTLSVDVSDDSAPALQAAIEAACVTRDEYADAPLPSLPVLLGGPYSCHRTLTVNVDPTQGTSERHLILKGRAGLGTPSYGSPSIRRFRNVALTSGGEDDQAGEGCLLRLGPNVGFEIENVNFTIIETAPRVEGCIDIDGYHDGGAPRRGIFRRCSFTGGDRYTLRVRAAENATLRRIHAVDCSIAPCSPNLITLHGVEVEAGHSTMLHIEGALMGVVAGDIAVYPTLESLPHSAALYLQGGSVLVQATQFHGAPGPRPSRGNEVDAYSIDLGEPDGQEVFLARTGGGRSSTHFTGMHLEDQGWWFLSRPQKGDDQVVLINVAHNNVNWGNGWVQHRYRAGFPAATSSGEGGPPSVVWLGLGGQCVLIGCRFNWSMLTEADAYPQITDVGTMFARYQVVYGVYPRRDPADPRTVRDIDPGRHFLPVSDVRSVPRPPSYAWRTADSMEVYDSRVLHLVPRLEP